MKSQEAPPLTGPSELGTSIVVAVTPDVLVQDGSSQSLVTVTSHDSNGRPLRNVSLRTEIMVDGVRADFGSLSARNIVTDTNGRATLMYTAPALPAGPAVDTPITVVNISVVPIGSDYGNATSRVATIRLVPPGTVVPADGLTPYFTTSTDEATDHQVIAFTACSDPDRGACAPPNNPIVSYSWNFGDGHTGTGRNASHAFDTPGTYVVTLTVADQYARTASVTQTVDVAGGTTPNVVLTFSPAAPVVGQFVNFNAAATRPAPGRTIRTYEWDFGDGFQKTTTTATTSHDYLQAGNFNVTLVVTDDAGRIGTGTVAVAVTGAAPSGQVSAPNVVGMTQSAASSAITAAGLTVGTVTPVSNSAAAGTVIFQNPAAGTLVPSGSAIAITVSVGP